MPFSAIKDSAVSAAKVKTWALILANVLLLPAAFFFARGFFPYKPLLDGLASFDSASTLAFDVVPPAMSHFLARPDYPPVFDRVILLVIDALRSDFVFSHESGFQFTQSLLRNGKGLGFTAHASSPTITMPRVKALTTGGVPSFVDVILNFAEGDDRGNLAGVDSILAQLKHYNIGKNEPSAGSSKKGSSGSTEATVADGHGKLVFYGDDTWLKLFPGFFERSEGTTSFFVSDFYEVDSNVTRHLPRELQKEDWNAMILHYLGLDHIGHKAGPRSPNMLPKQLEMDAIIRQIYTALTIAPHLKNTLLLVAGDHGMNEAGNHGGSAPGETSPALVFLSPKLDSIASLESRTSPTHHLHGRGEFDYYQRVEQSDIAPSLAGLMGFPIPRNNLGVFINRLAPLLGTSVLNVALQNAVQMLEIVMTTYPNEGWDSLKKQDCSGNSQEGGRLLLCKWQAITQHFERSVRVSGEISSSTADDLTERLLDFCHETQEIMSHAASNYEMKDLGAGVLAGSIAFILALVALPRPWLPSSSAWFYSIAILGYCIMAFASSYVEEEQQYWYYVTATWLAFQSLRRLRSSQSKDRTGQVMGSLLLLGIHRISIRWNQTGQKHAGASSIASEFLPHYRVFFWALVTITYVVTSRKVVNQALYRLPPLLQTITAGTLGATAFFFKIAHTRAEAPELMISGAFGESLNNYLGHFLTWTDLVGQARMVFAGILVCMTASFLPDQGSDGKVYVGPDSPRRSLLYRLEPLLTMFLLTQTRSQNIPLFLLLEAAGMEISATLRTLYPVDAEDSTRNLASRTLDTAVTILCLSNTAFFAFGGSNAISSIDLSNAYNGVSGYNVAGVGVLVFVSNWTGSLWWIWGGWRMLIDLDNGSATDASTTPSSKGKAQAEARATWIQEERDHLNQSVSMPKVKKETEQESARAALYTAYLTLFVAAGLTAVMTACTVLRAHLFVWTVFSPKFLYSLAWTFGWHLGVNCLLGLIMLQILRKKKVPA